MNDNTKFRHVATLCWVLCVPAALLMWSVSAQAEEISEQGDSWVFRRSRFSHDPASGARVAQYAMKPPIEPLPDTRLVTSGYYRSRSVLRGPDGSANTYYQVQSYGNGRGGMDAEWERFHDAWRGSTIGGGQYQSFPYGGGYPGYGGFGFGGPGYGGGYGGGGYGGGGYGGYGGYGQPNYGGLDPDGADGFPEPNRRRPFYRHPNPGHGRPGHGSGGGAGGGHSGGE